MKIKPYPTATLVMNRFGHIHAWPGEVKPQNIGGRSNFEVDGKDSVVYFQSEADINSVMESLPSEEQEHLAGGFVINTNFLSDEYFA